LHIFDLEQEHSNDEKKLLSLLQESQDERDELLSQQVSERTNKIKIHLIKFTFASFFSFFFSATNT